MAAEPSRLARVGSRTFRLEGDPELVERSLELIYPLPVASDAGAETVTLRRVGSRVRAEGRFGLLEFQSAAELLERLDYELTCLALADECAATVLHAACVEIQGRVLLLLGAHTHGKTTLALGLGRLGARVFSDDITILCARPLRVRPLSRAIRVRPDSARLLGLNVPGGGLSRLPPAEAGGSWLAPSACVEVQYLKHASAELTRLPTQDAILTLMKNVFGLAADLSSRLGDLAVLGDSAPVYRYTYGAEPVAGARGLMACFNALLERTA